MATGRRDSAAALHCKRPNVRAGLQFPIGKTAMLLKRNTSPQVTEYAAVYSAACLEYLTAEFGELSGNAAIKENAKMIEPRHLYAAVRNAEELNRLLQNLKIEIDNNEEEEVNGEDEEFNYNSEDEEGDEFPSDIVKQYEDDDTTSDEDDDTSVSADDQECDSVVVGQMSISPGSVELYTQLIAKFGEIVSPNLPKYKVEPSCVVLNDLLNLVKKMVDITPEEISQDMVSDWEGTISFYSDIGLKLGWLEKRVCRYRDWLVQCSSVDVNQLRGKVSSKQEELEKKRKEVSTLESELQELSTELEMAQLSQSQFGFSFFDQ